MTPYAVARQAPPSMGFLRQEYWSGLPFPPPGDLPDSGIEPASPAAWQADSSPLSHLGSPGALNPEQISRGACSTPILLKGKGIEGASTKG